MQTIIANNHFDYAINFVGAEFAAKNEGHRDYIIKQEANRDSKAFQVTETKEWS